MTASETVPPTGALLPGAVTVGATPAEVPLAARAGVAGTTIWTTTANVPIANACIRLDVCIRSPSSATGRPPVELSATSVIQERMRPPPPAGTGYDFFSFRSTTSRSSCFSRPDQPRPVVPKEVGTSGATSSSLSGSGSAHPRLARTAWRPAAGANRETRCAHRLHHISIPSAGLLHIEVPILRSCSNGPWWSSRTRRRSPRRWRPGCAARASAVEVAARRHRRAWRCAGELRPDLVVLDLMLPGPRRPRGLPAGAGSDRPVPVLMLTARDDETDMLVGLAVGADDYMTKPFSPARARGPGPRHPAAHGADARVPGPGRRPAVSPSATLELDAASAGASRSRRRRGAPHADGVRPARRWLAAQPGVVHTREQLLHRGLGLARRRRAPAPSTPTSGRCAASSAPACVRTVHGVGYALEPGDREAARPAVVDQGEARRGHRRRRGGHRARACRLGDRLPGSPP
ncbi:MAG: response regulator [Hymenobacter sp.]